MATYFPPIEDLPIFDNDVFDASNTDVLTIARANLLYLRKTVPDIATALETFVVGILSSSVEPLTTATGLNIASNQITGICNIANGNSRSAGATVNISNGSNNASFTSIMNGSNTTGTLSIRNGGGSGPTNIHTGTTTGLITIGSNNCVTNLNSATINFTRNASGVQPTFIECVSSLTTNQLDFHCNSANSVDYDSRILTFGGTAAAGNGSLEIVALNTNISLTTSGAVNIMNNAASTGTVNIATGAGGSAKVNIGNGSSTGNVEIGNSLNAVNINAVALSLGTATKAIQVNAPIRINYAPSQITLNTQTGYKLNGTALSTSIPSPPSYVNVYSVTLTAGIWMITANVKFTSPGSYYELSISSVSTATDNNCANIGAGVGNAIQQITRIADTTVVGLATFYLVAGAQAVTTLTNIVFNVYRIA